MFCHRKIPENWLVPIWDILNPSIRKKNILCPTKFKVMIYFSFATPCEISNPISSSYWDNDRPRVSDYVSQHLIIFLCWVWHCNFSANCPFIYSFSPFINKHCLVMNGLAKSSYHGEGTYFFEQLYNCFPEKTFSFWKYLFTLHLVCSHDILNLINSNTLLFWLCFAPQK